MKKISIWMGILYMMIFLVGCSGNQLKDEQDPTVQTQSESTGTSTTDSSDGKEGDLTDEEDYGEEGQTKDSEVKTPESDEPVEISDLATIYRLALEAVMPIDEGLNGDMTYIAINGETLVDATEEDITYILDYFTKYDLEVKNKSFKALKEDGLVKDGNYIEGILLGIDDVESKTDDKMVLHVSKFRSGLGAIGVKVTVIKNDESWEVESTEETWIS